MSMVGLLINCPRCGSVLSHFNGRCYCVTCQKTVNYLKKDSTVRVSDVRAEVLVEIDQGDSVQIVPIKGIIRRMTGSVRHGIVLVFEGEGDGSDKVRPSSVEGVEKNP